MNEASQAVKVTIFGREYPVAAGTGINPIGDVAAYVDGKMHELSGNAGGLPSGRVAVLACLNIADELLTLQQIEQKRRKALAERIDSLIELIDKELVG